MPRELTNLEIENFLDRHGDVKASVYAIEHGGFTALPLAYPLAGVAVQEPSGRYVLVWRDAVGRWHYIDLSDMSMMDTIAAETDQPAFISDPDYLGLIHEQIQQALNLTISGVEWVPLLVVGVLAVVLVQKFG